MHPILFQIGDFYVGTYGFLIVLGLVAGLFLALRLSGPRGIPGEFFYDLAVVALVAGFIGARLLYIGVNFEEFLADPMSLILSRFGFVFLGGLVAAAFSVLLLIKIRRMPKWEVADCAAPGLALGHAIGRIGCFLAGCCYGRVCKPDEALSFFAVRFPKLLDSKDNVIFSFAFEDHVHQGILAASSPASAPVLPSQLFESGSNLIIMALLLLLWRRRAFSGQIFGVYLMLYGTARFLLEFMRGDAVRGLYFGGLISTSQLISLAAVAVGVGIYLWRRPKGFEPPPELVPVEAVPAPRTGFISDTAPRRTGKKKNAK